MAARAGAAGAGGSGRVRVRGGHRDRPLCAARVRNLQGRARSALAAGARPVRSVWPVACVHTPLEQRRGRRRIGHQPLLHGAAAVRRAATDAAARHHRRRSRRTHRAGDRPGAGRGLGVGPGRRDAADRRRRGPLWRRRTLQPAAARLYAEGRPPCDAAPRGGVQRARGRAAADLRSGSGRRSRPGGRTARGPRPAGLGPGGPAAQRD